MGLAGRLGRANGDVSYGPGLPGPAGRRPASAPAAGYAL